MALMDSIFRSLIGGGSRRYGAGGLNRGRSYYGRSPVGYGRSRVGGGAVGGSLRRMAMGGLTAYGLRRIFGQSRPYGY